jgi:hypothetical protein
MDNSTIFTKTAKGVGEVAGKTKFLSRDFRKILKEVNGTTSLGGLKERLKSFSDDKLLDVLNELVLGDYIREFISPLSQNSAFDFSADAKLEDALTISDFLRYEQEMRSKYEIDDKIKADAEAQLQKKAEEHTRLESEEKAKRDVEAHAKRIAEEKVRNEEQARQEGVIQARKIAEEQARQKAQELARRQAEQKALQAKKDAEAQARRELEVLAKKRAEEEAQEQARRDAEIEAQLQAQIQAQKKAEDQARRDAEAQARKKAEDQARQKAQELARRQAEEKAQQAALLQAKKDAEAQVRRESDALAKKKAEEKARQEKEARARKKAEDQARREAEAEAQRQALLQAQKSAEDQARRDAAAQARKIAEDDARHRAQELARLEAEERAQREAEARARKELEDQVRKAEKIARLAAEAQAEKEADEKAQRDAEIQAIKEAEELIRREAEAQAKQIEAVYALSNAALQAQKDAEKKYELEKAELARKEIAQRIADEKNRAAQEKILRKQELEAQKKAQKEARKDADKAAKMEAQAEAQRKAQEKKQILADQQKEKAAKATEKASDKRNEKRYSNRSFSFAKPIAVLLFLLIVAGFGLDHLISFDDKIQLIEHDASEQFHQPVKIASVRLALVPQPHWRLDRVSIGNEGQIKVPEVNVSVDLASLFNGRVTFKSIGLASPAVSEEGLGWLLFGKSQKGDLKFGSVTATNIKLISSNINLPMMDALAEIGEDGAWKKIVLDASDKTFHMEMRPKDEALVQIELTADTYRVPFGSALVLDKFSAKGTANPDGLTVTEFGASLYDGIVSGNAKLMWGSTWSLKGDLSAKMIDAGKLLPSLLQNSKLAGGAKYAFQASTADKLLVAPHFKGNFSLDNGTLLGVDLMSLLRSQNSGGKSNFAEISGAFNYDSGRIQLRNMRLGAGMVSVNGSSDVDSNKNLSGNFVVDLKSPNMQMRSNLVLSGTLQEPSFHR